MIHDLLPRTVTTVVLIVAVLGVLVVAKAVGVPWVALLLLGAITVLGTLEVRDLAKKMGLHVQTQLLVTLNSIYVTAVVLFGQAPGEERFIPLAVLAAAMLLPLAWYASRRQTFKLTLVGWFSLFYIPFLLQFAYRVYTVEPFGMYYLVLLLGSVWTYDITAYLIGSVWGREQVLPEVSGKKTWEGVLGGMLGVYAFNASAQFWIPDPHFTWGLEWLLLPLFLTVVTQLGDLFESWIKRVAHVKDTGELLPGHGGILDRVDGLLFAAPVFYFYLREALKLF